MRHFVLLVCLTLVANIGVADDAKQARLKERMAAFSAAFNASDVPTLDSLLAENYSHTNNSAAPLNRAEWLASIERRRADTESGASKITSVETSEIEVQTQNNTAVGTGLYIMKGERNGNPYGLKIRFTQVWEWNGNDWYRVAFHDTYESVDP